jgi:hypothetical protein
VPPVTPQRDQKHRIPAAKRRKNSAHGASRGRPVRIEQAPKERKKRYDTDSRDPPFAKNKMRKRWATRGVTSVPSVHF